jgi:hypothetical protein
VPAAVHTRGVTDAGAVVHLSTQYLYDDPNLAVSAVSGALSQKGRPFAHGFEFYLERATLTFGFAGLSDAPQLDPLAVILPDGTVERPALGSGDPIDAFTEELAAAVAGVASGAEPPRLSGTLARQALAICRSEVQSVQTRQPVKIA